MTESFTRLAGDRPVEVLSPEDLPAEASTWPPEKVTMYWLSGQAASWRVRASGGEWIEIDAAAAERLHKAADQELDAILAELGA